MMYESTGEVRKPQVGEFYLTWPTSTTDYVREVAKCVQGDDYPDIDWKRVIMKPKKIVRYAGRISE